MPKTTKGGKPKKNELPSTLQRSNVKAQRTFAKTDDSAADKYGSEERAHRVAYAALKHNFEKVGDHWEPQRKEGSFRRAGEERWPTSLRLVGGGRRRRREQEAPAWRGAPGSMFTAGRR